MVLKNLLRLSLVLTVVVIALGAYTRLADAGLGCPDWPGCYGHLTVPDEHHEIALAKELYPSLTVEAHKAWLEMVHRYFAGTLGLLVFTITFLCLKSRVVSFGLPVALSVVIVFQALLGMWTVTMKLMPIVVMGHLLGGFTLFCLLNLLYWKVKDVTFNTPNLASSPVGIKALAGITLVLVIGQIALGGWTSSNYAALMCTSLPVCQGNWVDYLDFKTAFQLIQPHSDSYEFGTLEYGARMTIHVTHRLGAVVVTLFALWLAYCLLKTDDPMKKRAGRRVMLLLMVQILLGISNVTLSLPLLIAVAHNLGAAMLLVSVLHANYLLATSTRSLAANSGLQRKESAR